jgi:ABC-type Mn2+/Zn2+ transport system permease subunit
VPSPLDLIDLPFLRTAVAELALLALGGGVLGAWIVMRRLAFFTHAVGAVAFPALVVAAPIGIGAQPAALVAALAYAGGVGGATRPGRDATAATALLLVASLAAGIVLASDVVGASGSVDVLLFGTLLGLDEADLAASAVAAALAVTATLLLGRAWLASAFDAAGARAMRLPQRGLDIALLCLIAAAAVAALPAVGALLVTSLFVAPAATARLVAATTRGLFAASVGFAALQGLAGLYLAYAVDVPPGPAIAVVGAGLYACAAAARTVRSQPGTSHPADLRDSSA